jgi:molybdopterin synthase catalytic subunit
MTESSIEAIVDEAESRWPLLVTRVIHRVGTLLPEDQIVLVLVASGHRDAAFAAAEFIMDYLKTRAIFWKREASAYGNQWIESTGHDLERSEKWRAQPS